MVSATALKVEAPLVETPRPASVVEQEELEERNVQSLDETFRYRAGVLSGHFGEDNDTGWFKVRGFDQATYQDGLRIHREGFYQWLPEPFGLERVDLLLRSSFIFFQTSPREGQRGLVYRDGEINSWTVDNRLVGKWFTDRTENTLLVGVDYQDLNNRGKQNGAGGFTFFGDPIDLFNPQYGNFTPITPADLIVQDIDKQQTGYYLQNQLRLDDRWVFLAGARFVGETEDGDIDVPSYTVFDLMAQYALSPEWQAQVNVTNVADREYVASCDFWCYYGESRSVVGSISYRW